MINLAIIPARGGSKRISRKNIGNFLGKPIMAYSIEIALQSGLFDEVMVSTDDEEIAQIALKFGAKVPFFRSMANSNDYATTLEVIQEVILEYKSHFERTFDRVCCIYPTAPLIQIQHLKKGLSLILSKNFDCVFPIVPFGYPIWRGLEISEEGKTRMVWPDNINSRSQDLKKVYHDAGQWYWLNMNQLGEIIFTQNCGSIVLSEEEVQDIDNLSDWKLTELKYKLLNEA